MDTIKTLFLEDADVFDNREQRGLGRKVYVNNEIAYDNIDDCKLDREKIYDDDTIILEYKLVRRYRRNNKLTILQ